MMYEDLEKIRNRDISALRFIVDHISTNGYPPSVREVGIAINVTSSSTAQKVVNRLVRRGWISTGGRVARAIRITPDGMEVLQ